MEQERVQVLMLETKDSLQKGNKYFLPEDLAETFQKNNIAVILILPGSEDVRSVGPKEFKSSTTMTPEDEPKEDEEKEDLPEPAPVPVKTPPPAPARPAPPSRPVKHVPAKHPRKG